MKPRTSRKLVGNNVKANQANKLREAKIRQAKLKEAKARQAKLKEAKSKTKGVPEARLKKEKTQNARTHQLIEKIGLRPQARTRTSFKFLKGSYSKLKARGVNFSTLKNAGYSTQMMLELGMPVEELIAGHKKLKGGIQTLVTEVTNLHNSTNPHSKKLNFRTLVKQGISLKEIRQARAQLGLLLVEGFTKQELVQAGYEASRIDSVIRLLKK